MCMCMCVSMHVCACLLQPRTSVCVCMVRTHVMLLVMSLLDSPLHVSYHRVYSVRPPTDTSASHDDYDTRILSIVSLGEDVLCALLVPSHVMQQQQTHDGTPLSVALGTTPTTRFTFDTTATTTTHSNNNIQSTSLPSNHADG